MSLKGKIAVVAGSSRGIGKAIALHLARSGASLALLYNSDTSQAEKVQQEAVAIGAPRAELFKFDISSVSSIREAFAQIATVFQHVDISIVNSGVFAGNPLLSVSEEEFDKVFNINTKGAFFTAQESAKILRDEGRIIFISSVVTKTNFPGSSVYTASKGAVNQFARILAGELGPRKITVNTVSPGFTETDMLSPTLHDLAKQSAPFKRIGTVDDIANAVDFLVSDAGIWVNGTDINVSGGAVV